MSLSGNYINPENVHIKKECVIQMFGVKIVEGELFTNYHILKTHDIPYGGGSR